MSQNLASQRARILIDVKELSLRQNDEAEARVLGMRGAGPVSAALGIAAGVSFVQNGPLSISNLGRVLSARFDSPIVINF